MKKFVLFILLSTCYYITLLNYGKSNKNEKPTSVMSCQKRIYQMKEDNDEWETIVLQQLIEEPDSLRIKESLT